MRDWGGSENLGNTGEAFNPLTLILLILIV